MKRIIIQILILTIALSAFASDKVPKKTISLAGEWKFALDEKDIGNSEKWYKKSFTERVTLPGSLQEQGKGFDVTMNTPWTGDTGHSATDPKFAKYRVSGNIKVPYWLNPDKHYVGVAWYQKSIEIPAGWENRPVEIQFERTHWETTLYLDGEKVGDKNALQTPHRYVLNSLKKGIHIITLRVDNRVNIDVGKNAHSVSDHTQSNWNGLIGKMSITAKTSMYIDDIQLYPDIESKSVKIEATVKGSAKKPTLRFYATFNGRKVGKEIKLAINPQTNKAEGVMLFGEDIKLWSEFTPNVYQMHSTLETSDGADSRSIDFGFRNFKTKGMMFEINGLTTFLRGTLECCIFPYTGYPAMDKRYWEKIYSTCKDYGLNHVRFHSWCPPKAAFQVADSMGIYLMVECGGWANIGDGNPQDEWFKEEGDRILKEYGNHPSFCMLAYGNEPNGKNQVKYLSELVDYWQKKDNRRLYTGGAGWPYVENADFNAWYDTRISGGLDNALNTGLPRTDFDHRAPLMKVKTPMIGHEIGQYCVYPNFKEIAKYTGVLKAKNFEIFRETLQESGLADMSEKFLYASGKLQAICYKADIEAALRTPGQAGFQLLDLHDFPGQGSALVGVLDAFWDSKGYIYGEEYRTFCNQVVPIVRFPKLILTNEETLDAKLQVAYYAEKPMTNAGLSWKIETREGKEIKNGRFTADLPQGGLCDVGVIKASFPQIDKPTQLKVTVQVDNTPYHNSWNIWVYPAKQSSISKMPHIAHTMDNVTLEKLQNGENVLLLAKGNIAFPKECEIKVAFSPIFWNTAWSGNQPPHTLGIYCEANHPALKSFPNDGYSDYQWRDLTIGSDAIVMKDFPKEFRPIIYLIDDWFQNRKLGLLFETKVGKGKLLVCSSDLESDLNTRLSAKQFKQSILEYMASDSFQPKDEIDLNVVKGLFK
ncbi:sugar-binding domain-containing protein [Prevotella sp. 10(H)]|uniref:sugar-binding domain-containing protein n=1 Tax=Prevotella sp. 10(H) TaxID=1158294 RepID=UPI0004A6C762|nr:sugar-binding domain-containing protein [Prevotella sp. 10(H)]